MNDEQQTIARTNSRINRAVPSTLIHRSWYNFILRRELNNRSRQGRNILDFLSTSVKLLEWPQISPSFGRVKATHENVARVVQYFGKIIKTD